MESVKVSVLLPVYNGGLTLSQAIASILCQNMTEFELIIIDDCSTDNSASIIRQYAEKDSRINPVFHDVNIGLARTLNEGLSLAQSDFVARMDQDDESLPQRLRIQHDYMHGHPEVTVVGSYVYHMGAKQEFDRLVELPSEAEQIKQTLLQYNCMYHPSVMMRRNKICDLGGYQAEFKNAEDYDLWLRVSKIYPLTNITEPLLRYRFSVTGMTLSRKWEQLFYVYLAQACHENEMRSMEFANLKAQEMLKKMDKAYFLREVANGTISELLKLKLWRDAIDLTWKFSIDVGVKKSVHLLMRVVKSYLIPHVS
ncbi:glycosyltransferase [Pseudanabaena sp. lw0831]|uniref:glycosyltransferase family 2 protein n=1 Tax=Pseudanabaena sp. lw0831 TaxID=1357935 RepID=UPI00191690C7|nr:glycosyltransferase [Pseudanabaena sp. lw0831]GBO52273.1 glycosyltransferase [Pseudanabaena sp. lw0831]